MRWLGDAGIDLLEISGGTYEQMEFLKAHAEDEVRDSTRRREATFLEYAKAIKPVAAMPLMVTGGFRTLEGMEAALREGHTDVIGCASAKSDEIVMVESLTLQLLWAAYWARTARRTASLTACC